MVGQGHGHALFGQGRAAVRWLQKLAQISRLVFSSDAYNWNDALLRIFEVMLCVFSWSFCISFSEEKKRCRTLLPCDVLSTNPGVWKSRKSVSVSGSWEGVASEKKTTSQSKRERCSDANPNLSVLVQIAFVAVLHRSSHNFSLSDSTFPAPHIFCIERVAVENDRKTETSHPEHK